MKNAMNVSVQKQFIFFAVAAMCLIQFTNAKQPPNFIIISGDDLGYADVGFTAPHDKLFWQNCRTSAEAIRIGNTKLVGEATTDLELYDLANDIGEERNLAPAHLQKVQEYYQIYEEW